MALISSSEAMPLLQLGLDAEALGALDVLQIDAAERDADVLDHRDDLVGVFGGDLDVDGVDVAEALEEHRLALHHRLGGQSAQVAQAQDRGAVGDHRHQVALGGVVVGEVRVLGDRQDGHGDAGGVGQGQVALGGHRLGGDDADLPGGRIAVEVQRFLVREGLLFRVAHAAIPCPA
jgi:hypothetical protein